MSIDSRDLFERFFSLAAEFFLVTNGNGRIERVNSTWKDRLGYDVSDLEGEDLWKLFHPEDLEANLAFREALRREGSARRYENRVLRKGGSFAWLRWNGFHDPETGFIYAMAIDCTAERLARERQHPDATEVLREREKSELLRQLIETSKDGFGYCDMECRPVYLNRFLTEELGWKIGESSLYDFVSPETARVYREDIFPRFAMSRMQWEGEVEFKNWKTGELVPIWQKAFFSLDEFGEPRYFAFFATDLRGKRSAEAALLHNSKMASLGQMAAGVAHEVNNPITIIHGTAGLLKRSLQGGDFDHGKLVKGLDRVEKTSMRISKIIRGLRMFSRSGENDPPVSTSLRDIVEETLDVSRERFRDHAIELRVAEIPERLLRCRPTQISQVLLNLLNNSFDAVVDHPDKWVAIDFSTSENAVRISVTDSGRGIPKEVAQRLMEPFFTTKDPGKGTGLGLPISRGIIEGHGGKLIYDSESPWTRFVIELPTEKESISTPA